MMMATNNEINEILNNILINDREWVKDKIIELERGNREVVSWFYGLVILRSKDGVVDENIVERMLDEKLNNNNKNE